MPRKKQDLRKVTFNVTQDHYDYLNERPGTITDGVEEAIGLKLTVDALAGETGFITWTDEDGDKHNLITNPAKFADHIGHLAIQEDLE